MKNQKGITLIALVITIIVLLILAGVSIAMLTGSNGILAQATNANTQNLKAEADEAVKMALNTIMTNKAASDAGSTANGPTTATADNILTVIKANNPNASSSTVKTTGNEGAVRVITYKASANSKSVDVTISAEGVVSTGDPY